MNQHKNIFTKGPAPVLVHATSVLALNCKLGVDATKILRGELSKRPRPPLIKMDAAARMKINSLFGKAA